MNKFRIILLLAILLLVRCYSFDPAEPLDYKSRIIIKKILVKDGLWIEWYNYSLITDMSPGYVEFKSKDSSRVSICESPVICDLNYYNDTLRILLEENSFQNKTFDNNFNVKIVVDTTCKGRSLYK
jgi:hypothetical protein